MLARSSQTTANNSIYSIPFIQNRMLVILIVQMNGVKGIQFPLVKRPAASTYFPGSYRFPSPSQSLQEPCAEKNIAVDEGI